MAELRIPDINSVTIAGRITRDPELKYLPSGMALCSFGIAHDRHYKDKSGEKKKDTTFVEVECWAKTAEIVAEHLGKGDPVFVEGRLKYEQWEDKTSGQKRSKLTVTAHRVQPLAWKGTTEKAPPRPAQAAKPAPDDDDLPEDDISF